MCSDSHKTIRNYLNDKHFVWKNEYRLYIPCSQMITISKSSERTH